MFYTFVQNNSGGRFTVNGTVSQYVIIEAEDAEHANERAKDIGIYFDGVAEGWDCECCGDRWYPVWNDERGTEMPEIYGTPVEEYVPDLVWSEFEGKPLAYVYYMDGRKEAY